MARVVKPRDVRKEELINIAMNQFLARGYEKTSIRSILGEAGGEVGMFYHYFTSKNEIYEAALRQYNERYVAGLRNFVEEEPDQDFYVQLDRVLNELENALGEYSGMDGAKVNPEMTVMIYASVMQEILPLFEEIVGRHLGGRGSERGQNTHLLSAFLLYGMGGIIHDRSVESFEEKAGQIKALFCKLLE